MVRTDTGRAGGDAVANLLFGAYRRRVLSLLFLRPGERFHVRQIARLTGIPAGSLHRELRQLAEAGLLTAERTGNQLRYGANQDAPVYGELAAMLEKTAAPVPTLHEPAAGYAAGAPGRLAAIDTRLLAAACRKYGVRRMSLFGSAARNELRPDSDVDLLVEFKPSSRTSSLDLVRMQDELSPLFGDRRVQIAGKGILRNPYRRKAIEPELKVLYEERTSSSGQKQVPRRRKRTS